MSVRICMCCGEPMAEKGGVHSLKSNICASCSSFSDETPESSMSRLTDFDENVLVEVDFRPVMAEPVKALSHG